jgi:D-3-phosphoglycerate dehydrogenase
VAYNILASTFLEYSNNAIGILRKSDCTIDFYDEKEYLRNNIFNSIYKYHAFIGGGYWNEECFQKAKNLKILARLGSGVDTIDLKAATRHGVAVTNTPGANSTAVAEHTLGLILTLSRKIYLSNADMKKKSWNPRINTELKGKTLGVVGLGNIGKDVVRKIVNFDIAKILAYDLVKDLNFIQQYEVEYVDLDGLLAESDIITIHCSLNQKTHHLIDYRQLAKIKSSAILINVSRGGIINEEALINFLEKNKIAGVGLDVFEEEPLSSESKLLTFENVILTPHIASFTIEAFQNMAEMAVKNVIAVLKDKRPINLVNPEVFNSSANN